MKHLLILLTLLAIVPTQVHAMELRPIRLLLWTHGETIDGEDFVLATEDSVDYIGTLRRPTGGGFSKIAYNCMAKRRISRPSVVNTDSSMPMTNHVVVQMLYELRDCVEQAK